MKRFFSAPTTVQLEITDICNEHCRHCYNFWRRDNIRSNRMSRENFDALLHMLVEAGVFHVILTGGEPFAHFELLEYGFRKLLDNNISISCNSNLTMATEDQLRRLRDIGLDHILTSLNSCDPATNDFIVNRDGAFRKIIKGIETAVRNGIRISTNMIVSQHNKDHVYRTALLAAELGCQKIFGTRVVPSVYEKHPNTPEFTITAGDALHTLEQLLRARQETGIMIGTLVSYPLCLLGDLEKYRDFVGRGCPGQAGHLMSINADGDTHACVHQEQSYGNVFRSGIRQPYLDMRAWHDKTFYHADCEGCDYLDICRTGCRMTALAFNGSMSARDTLMAEKGNITKPYRVAYDSSVFEAIDAGARFTVPKRLRFRQEDGFYLVNIRWANTIVCETEPAEFLIRHQKSGNSFDLASFGPANRALLADLCHKDAVESASVIFEDDRALLGLSADISS